MDYLPHDFWAGFWVGVTITAVFVITWNAGRKRCKKKPSQQ